MKLIQVKQSDSTRAIFGWSYAFEEVYKHQHPQDCKKAKFVIAMPWNGGFGSQFHVYGSGLGLAMNMGRVYLESPVTDSSLEWQFTHPDCLKNSKSNLECFYEAWSNCTLVDALGEDGLQLYTKLLGGNNRPNFKRFYAPAFNEKYHDSVLYAMDWSISANKRAVHTLRNTDTDPHRDLNALLSLHSRFRTVLYPRTVFANLRDGVIPVKFHSLMKDCLPMESRNRFYWWRAVAASYMIRPNAMTLSWLSKQRECAGCTHFMTEEVASQALSVYIRHGDKGREMSLVPVKTYFQVASEMFSLGYVRPDYHGVLANISSTMSARNTRTSKSNQNVIFFGTETPAAFRSMSKLCSVPQCKLLYTSPAPTAARRRSTYLDYMSMLLSLESSLRCAAWVCTLASNWCRVVDELRATVAFKANHVFADLSIETCSVPPCYGGVPRASKVVNFGEPWKPMSTRARKKNEQVTLYSN